MSGSCGGIILTASHNPRQWNALKLLNEKGEFLNAVEGAEVLALAAAEAFEFADIDHIGHYTKDDSYDQKHIDSVLALDLVDVEAIRKAEFKVAIDCVNSVGGVVLPKLLNNSALRPSRVSTASPQEISNTTPSPWRRTLPILWAL